jgi:hypothetical protein
MIRPRSSPLSLRAPLALLLALALSGAGCGRQPNADQVIARCIAARGGRDALRAIQSKRLIGRVVFAKHDSGAFIVEMKRPGKMRQEMNLTGGEVISTLDGMRGWAINSMRKQTAPETLTAGQVHNMAGGADMDGPLVDWKEKGNRVELLGVEQVRGRDAWKLKVTQPGPQVRYDFIDCASKLEVKWVGVLDQGGQSVTFESYFTDYRPVSGTMHAFRIESGATGSPLQQVLEFDRIDVNVPIDDADFGPPTLAAPARGSGPTRPTGRQAPAHGPDVHHSS